MAEDIKVVCKHHGGGGLASLWIIGWLFRSFGLFDEQLCSFNSSHGFRISVALDMDERCYQRDPELDLFAATRGR